MELTIILRLRKNKLRTKGQMYFPDMDVTGSAKGTEKDAKFSLLDHHGDVIIPALQIICAQHSEWGTYDMGVKYAMDGADCHQDKAFLTYLEGDFAECGWVFKFRPNQSPITNVHDACIFPSLSKSVTNE